jgi:integrase
LREIDALISGCGKKTSAYLQLLKETAFRPIEALRLKWRDVDVKRRAVNLTSQAKYSNPRQLEMSINLLNMLPALPRNSIHLHDL